MTRTLLRAGLLGVTALTLAAGAAMAQRPDLNTDKAGLALHGYDAVAYFTEGKAVEGSPAYTATYGGATYRFATAAHRDAFRSEPARYAPQYGGYCAMGVAVNKHFDIDPTAWKIVDGKLYLNKDPGTQRVWLKDVPGNIAKAERHWPSLSKTEG